MTWHKLYIIDHHIVQAYYATYLGSQLLGVNYVYELPLRTGFLGAYGGIDLGAIPKGATSFVSSTESVFNGHLNIGARYRVKSAFVDLGINTSFANIKSTTGIYSTTTTTTTFPFGFMLSVGLMLDL